MVGSFIFIAKQATQMVRKWLPFILLAAVVAGALAFNIIPVLARCGESGC